MMSVRIQKALADAGIASRRRAEELVAAGRVQVDGVPARVGMTVDRGTQRIEVDGRPIESRSPAIHLAMHKPAGVTSTVADRHAGTTVLDLVPRGLVPPGARLYPVGRLDRDSEGLLLLTNDGDWAQRVLHPRYQVEREYAVATPRPLTGDQAAALLGGVVLREGTAALLDLRPAIPSETESLLHLLQTDGPAGIAWYRATLGQGWRRQVRRMFDAVGVPVVRLVRVRIGTLRLGTLRPGQVRRLTAAEAASVVQPAPPQSGVSRARRAPGPGGRG
ncbi:MAG TPA: pseudouridine synthase [Candidatus Acidoferrales bacterium]|nr:pseudouridine synthase [Candidatus Acidoferrales bacterium]